MAQQQSGDSVLVLEDELILGPDPAGQHAIIKEPGVLLLNDELAPEPVIKKIDVGSRVSNPGTGDARQDEEFKTQFLNAWQSQKSARAVREALWQGAEADQPTVTFIRRVTQPQIPPQPHTSPQPADAAELSQILAEARALAAEYGAMGARTRKALYQALGRIYDLTIRADEWPGEFARLLAGAGLATLDRAPFTPIVKLVFGADCDKTRVAEFAAAISYGRRRNLPVGGFTAFLDQTEGGLKAVVGLERLFRKGAADPAAGAVRDQARPAIARKLRAIAPAAWTDLPSQGDEFMLVVARRLPSGSVAVIGEVPRDIALLERAARKLLAERGGAAALPG